jgi:hypothetical protein
MVALAYENDDFLYLHGDYEAKQLHTFVALNGAILHLKSTENASPEMIKENEPILREIISIAQMALRRVA